MSEGPTPVQRLRVGAVLAGLTVSPSIRVRVLAMADALQIGVPFGDLIVPYAAITRVTRDVKGGIRLDLSGATVRLNCSGVPEMTLNALFDLLKRKTVKARG